jgi:hypothetical protein
VRDVAVGLLDVEARGESGVLVRDQRGESLQGLRCGGHAGSGDQKWRQVTGVGIAQKPLERQLGGARLGRHDPVQVHRKDRRDVLVVAQHQHPQPLAEVATLDRDDLCQRVGLRLAAGEHPVDRGAATPDPGPCPAVPDRRQRPADRVHHVLVGRVAGALQVTARPVVDQGHPVLRARRLSMLLEQPGTVGQTHETGVMQAKRCVAQLRLVRGEAVPRDRALRGTDEPAVDPLQEADRPEPRVREPVHELGEPFRLARDVVVLPGAGGGQPGHLGERSEVPLTHHGGDRRLVDDPAEQVLDETRLCGRQGRGRSCRQAQHERVGQLGQHLVEEPAPNLQEVVALVEHHGEVGLATQALDQRLSVRVQAGQQALPAALLVDLLVRQEGGQGLVGQGGEERREVAVRPGNGRMVAVRQELVPAPEPLGLDGGVRAEHHGPAPATPRRLEPDQGLPRPGWEDDPCPRPTSRADPVDRVESLALVTAECVRVAQAFGLVVDAG